MVRQLTPESAPRFFLAACVAEFAEVLRVSEHANDGNFGDIKRILERVAIQLPLDKRVKELLWMVRRAEGLPRA